MTPLNRKLVRDLWRIKGQATAIGAVIAVGVLMLVMMSGLVTSLDETRRAYYERYRFADVFPAVNRAPDRLIKTLASIPGVAMAEGRVTGSALIDLPGKDLPYQAMTVSIPDFDEPRLNDFYLTQGRRVEGAFNEVLLSLDLNANLSAILDLVDQTLEPWGGLGAYGRKDQNSNRFISEEIDGLKATSRTVPPVFLAVSAFLLYLVLRRVFALTPALAMRPPAPPDYSRAGTMGKALNSILDQPGRMVLRRLMRQPVRMAGAMAGIAALAVIIAAIISDGW